MSCAFCKKSRDDVRYLLAGPGVNICDVCVATCIDLIAEWDRGKTGAPTAGNRLYRHFKALDLPRFRRHLGYAADAS